MRRALSHFLPDLREAFEGLVQRFVLLREMDAGEVAHFFLEERGARHHRDADLFRQLLAELRVGPPALEFGDVEHHEIGALRLCEGDADLFQAFDEDVALVRILGGEFPVVARGLFEARDDRLLQGRGGADGEKVVDLLALVAAM